MDGLAGLGHLLNKTIGDELAIRIYPIVGDYMGKATILINYNTEYEIKSLCRSLPSITDIYVVDNSPTSEFESWCYEHGIEYLRSPENLGYPGGINFVIPKIQDKYNNILILNPDVDIGDGTCVENLLKRMEDEESIGILGPTVRYPDGTKQNYPPHPVPRLFRKLNLLPELATTSRDDLLIADSIKGCAMLINTDLFHEIGLFKEEFFMYREETEFCYRARKHGHTVAIATDISVYHPDSKGVNHDTPLQMYYDIRNRFHLANSIFEGVELIPAYLITFASIVMQVVRIVDENQYSLIRPLFLGFFDGLLGRNGKTRYVTD